ncbi:hypothetical protein CL621_01555 [archaeon]|nr:hypothetical protein [archaeon]|tara:strand:- start:1939 stop:3000 length:1062 start_codon:yes stop_codon:yes gene_type:complete
MKKEIIERILSWNKGIKQGPIKFDIFLTNKCNLNCKFCAYPRLNNIKEELNKEKILDLLKEAKELNAKIFGILGGEPFVRKDTIEIMRRAKQYDMDGSLVTNGTLLSEEDLKSITEMHWDLIRFSVDGSKKEIHDFLRGKEDSFSKTTTAIKKLQEIKGETETNSPTIEINTVLCKKNILDLPNIITLSNELKIKRIYLLPMIEFVEDIEDLKIKDIQTTLKVIDQSKNLAADYNITVNLDEIKENYIFTKPNEMDEVKLSKNNSTPCFLPWYSICINAYGDVTPCAVLAEEKEAFCGNINEETLDKIWYGNKFSKIRENMAKQKMLSACSRCCMPLHEENNKIREEIKEWKS